MPAAPAPAVEPSQPDPPQDRPNTGANAPNHPSRLLFLVRLLITYGTKLVSALEQRTPTSNLFTIHVHFGTIDIGKIIASITRGLQRAADLEARLLHRLAHPRAAPASRSAPSVREPRPTKAPPEDPQLPTPDQIAAALRRRPIGAVLADICRDLGIAPANPLWQELSLAIIMNGGNLTTLFKDTSTRISTFLLDPLNPLPVHPPGSPLGLAPHLLFAMMPGGARPP